MDIDKLIGELTTVKAESITLKGQSEALVTANAALTETNKTLTAQLDAFKAKEADLSKIDELKAAADTAKADRKAMYEVILEEGNRLLVACGKEKFEEGKEVELSVLTKTIVDCRAELATKFPVGGKSNPSNSNKGDNEQSNLAATASAFKAL